MQTQIKCQRRYEFGARAVTYKLGPKVRASARVRAESRKTQIPDKVILTRRMLQILNKEKVNKKAYAIIGRQNPRDTRTARDSCII